MMSSRVRRYAVLLVAVLGTVAAGCRLDGLLRISVDLADYLPADAREGSTSDDEWLDDDDEIGDFLRLYFFPGVQAVSGDDKDDLIPDLELQKAREIRLDLPGDRRIIEAIELLGRFTLENTGSDGVFIDPRAEIRVAPPDADSVYDDDDPASHAVGTAEVTDTVGAGGSVTLAIEDARVERDDPAFEVIEDGHFRLGLFLEVGLGDGGGDDKPKEIAWRIDTVRLEVTGQPIRALD